MNRKLFIVLAVVLTLVMVAALSFAARGKMDLKVGDEIYACDCGEKCPCSACRRTDSVHRRCSLRGGCTRSPAPRAGIHRDDPLGVPGLQRLGHDAQLFVLYVLQSKPEAGTTPG
jgi:hypothetical protein